MENLTNNRDRSQVDFLTQVSRVTKRAEELLKEYELFSWRFELAATKGFVGRCYYHRNVIEFSKYYLESPWHEIEDTLRHEVAHALVGPNHGHDEVWKRKAIELGARPITCAVDSISTAKHNYKITCTACGRVWRRHRLKNGYTNGDFKSGCCHAEMKVEVI